MKRVDLYEMGEEVYVKGIISRVDIDEKGNIKYGVNIKNTGNGFEYVFSPNQITPIKVETGSKMTKNVNSGSKK